MWCGAFTPRSARRSSPNPTHPHICTAPTQVRGIAGDLVEEVKLIDNFTHPKTVSKGGWGGCVKCLWWVGLGGMEQREPGGSMQWASPGSQL